MQGLLAQSHCYKKALCVTWALSRGHLVMQSRGHPAGHGHERGHCSPMLCMLKRFTLRDLAPHAAIVMCQPSSMCSMAPAMWA